MDGLDYSRRNNQFQVDYDYVCGEEHVWYYFIMNMVMLIGA